MNVNKVTRTAIPSLLVFSMVMVACSSKNEGVTTGTNESAKPVTTAPVNISLWTGYPELDPWLKKMAEEYKKEKPNVTVEISSFPLRDFEKKTTTSLPSGTAADIISINPSIALKFIESNMILKAPDSIAKLVQSGIFSKPLVDDATYKGAIYGVPHMGANSAIFYNTKMFAEAGLTAPPKNMEELLSYAKKLTKYDAAGKVERSGFSLRLSGGGSGVAEKFWILMQQNGGGILKEVSPGKFKTNYDNEAGLKTLNMYVDMVHKSKVDDPTIKHDTEAFEMEKTAMFVRESWVIGDIKQKAPNLQYATAPMPAANLIVEKDFYVTNAAKGDKAAAAWDFINFVMKPDNHKQQLVMNGWNVARDDLKLDDFFKEVPQFKSYFSKYDKLEVYPLIQEFDEIQTKFADRLATKGFTDPSFVDNPDKMKAFLAEAAKESNEILKKNGHLAD